MRLFVLALIPLAALSGCVAEDSPAVLSPSTTAAGPRCRAEVKEALDPGSGRHVLPGASEPIYSTDPPTSGAHQPGQHPTGDLSEPVSRPIQVSMIEDGGVLIQYRSPADRRVLEKLVRDNVSIAPNPGIADAVVATAWMHKLRCSGVDVDSLARFASAHAGGSPGH